MPLLRPPACSACKRRENPPLLDCYLDIEALGLKANFSPMLCWSILDRQTGKIIHSTIESWSLAAEKKLVARLLHAMRQYERVITFNGLAYDCPFARTRALRHGLTPPEHGEIFHLDVYLRARGRLSAHRKNLATLARVLGVVDKKDLDPRDWELANFGDRAALRRISAHCDQDVRVLRAVHEKIEPFCAKPIKRSI